MKIPLKVLLTAIMAFWVGIVAAQSLEVIELKSRTADEVLPSLLPLVESGGTLTGFNNQLFLRASPRNREEIKRALAAMDRPARRLVIHVAHDLKQRDAARGAAGRGQVVIGSGGGSQLEARVWDTRSQRAEQSAQRIQTLEGGRAFIQVGRALPVPMRQIVLGPGGVVVSEAVVYRDIGSGFQAIPRLNGDRVTLDIAQQAERMDARQPGEIEAQRLMTTVSGRLGEWIELGGTGQEGAQQQGGGFSVGTGSIRNQRSIWLMVEELH